MHNLKVYFVFVILHVEFILEKWKVRLMLLNIKTCMHISALELFLCFHMKFQI